MTVIVLLALSDSGAPAYDHEHAAALAELGVPAFACTPDQFPDLLAVAIGRGDIAQWAATTAAASASRSCGCRDRYVRNASSAVRPASAVRGSPL